MGFCYAKKFFSGLGAEYVWEFCWQEGGSTPPPPPRSPQIRYGVSFGNHRDTAEYIPVDEEQTNN